MKRTKIIRISTVPCSLETFLKGQLSMLSKHYEVVAISSPDKDLNIIEEREKVRTIAVPMERHISLCKDLVSLFRLIYVFSKERPYVVHSMTPKAGLLSMLAAWITRVPVRIHTFTGLVFPTSKGFMRKLLLTMDRLTCFCCTYVNPEGYGVKHDLERFNVTRKPLHVIANGNVRGIDLTYYTRTKEVEQKANGLRKKNLLTFCFVGRLVGDKGINELVEAFTRLCRSHNNVRLLLVGPYEDELDPLLPATMQLILSNSAIETVGNQLDVRPYLAASDFFVFPSYREGFPNVVLEAGAMGLPSIVTDINGSNEIIIPNKNGEIIPSKDTEALYAKMEDWVTHPEKIHLMAQNARNMVAERYEQHLIWNALLKEYQTLIK